MNEPLIVKPGRSAHFTIEEDPDKWEVEAVGLRHGHFKIESSEDPEGWIIVTITNTNEVASVFSLVPKLHLGTRGIECIIN